MTSRLTTVPGPHTCPSLEKTAVTIYPLLVAAHRATLQGVWVTCFKGPPPTLPVRSAVTLKGSRFGSVWRGRMVLPDTSLPSYAVKRFASIAAIKSTERPCHIAHLVRKNGGCAARCVEMGPEFRQWVRKL